MRPDSEYRPREQEPKEPQISVFFSLGHHTSLNTNGGQVIDTQASTFFKPDIKSAYIMEEAFVKPSIARPLTIQMNTSSSATEGYVKWMMRGSTPNPTSAQIDNYIRANAPNNFFFAWRVTELRAIDRLRQQFNTQIYMEECPDSEFLNEMNLNTDKDKQYGNATRLSYKGSFNDAFKAYRQAVNKDAQLDEKRDGFIRNTIDQIAANAVTANEKVRVFARVGSRHFPLAQRIQENRATQEFTVDYGFDYPDFMPNHHEANIMNARNGEPLTSPDRLTRGLLSFLLVPIALDWAVSNRLSLPQHDRAIIQAVESMNPQEIRMFVKNLARGKKPEDQLTDLLTRNLQAA